MAGSTSDAVLTLRYRFEKGIWEVRTSLFAEQDQLDVPKLMTRGVGLIGRSREELSSCARRR